MINSKFWLNKKVLITGHTGFKGGWLSIWMNIMGAKVAGYSLNPISQKNLFESAKLKKIFEKDYRKNIQDYNSLDQCIKKFRPEIIFHLAAQPQVLESFNNPYDTVLTNVVGTTNLLEIVKKKKFVKSLVVVTTDKVYKNSETKKRFSENDPLGGDDLYSASKASADLISSSYYKSFFQKSNCGVATVRAGNCIGGGDWTKFRILTDASEAFSKNKNLNIRNPNSRRPWQHVMEPLFGYIAIAENIYGNKKIDYCTSWNFGPERRKHLKVIEFARLFKLKMKSKSSLIFNKNPDMREKIYLDLDSGKSKRKMGWKPVMTIEETLEYTADWYMAHRNKRDMYKFTVDQIKKFMKLK
jgi:CDP-glucose 4,6-dehydratase